MALSEVIWIALLGTVSGLMIGCIGIGGVILVPALVFLVGIPIQIAIPADEMFPPGAVPEGIHFVADLTIAPDGSAERLQLRPRLAGFERRTTQP